MKNESGMRALSQTELQKRQIAQNAMMSQALLTPIGTLAYLNYQNCLRPAPERRPLDERFADFKLRLANALEKRKAVMA